MVHRIGAASGVEGVAVSQVGLAAEGTHQVGHAGSVVGPEEGQVAGLAEVHFYGYELVLEIDLLDAGGLGHGFHLLYQGKSGGGMQVSEVNFCFFHNVCTVFVVSSGGIPCGSC